MNLIKQIWSKLNDPVLLWNYAITCVFMMLTAFTVKKFNYSIAFDIIKGITVIFSMFIYSKVISRIIKSIQKS